MYTYDLSETGDLLIVSQIRLEIGDTVEGQGVKPDGTNFQDDELLHFYNDEGSAIGRTYARCFEVLAAAWSNVPRTKASLLEVDPNKVAANHMKNAERLRERYGVDSGPDMVLVHATRATATTGLE